MSDKTNTDAGSGCPAATCSRLFDTPETDEVATRWAGNEYVLREKVCTEFARRLERERNEAASRCIALADTLKLWLEWARMHGHLDHAGGIADRTRELISENNGFTAKNDG